jgi:hypothetical protein
MTDDQGSPRATTRQRSLVRAWADNYVETTNAGKYDALGALFARDAVFLPPNGATLRGPDEIGAFYQEFLPTLRPTIRISTFLEDGAEAMFVLVASTLDNEEERLGAVDHVTVDRDGLATRLVIFPRPQP